MARFRKRTFFLFQNSVFSILSVFSASLSSEFGFSSTNKKTFPLSLVIFCLSVGLFKFDIVLHSLFFRRFRISSLRFTETYLTSNFRSNKTWKWLKFPKFARDFVRQSFFPFNVIQTIVSTCLVLFNYTAYFGQYQSFFK